MWSSAIDSRFWAAKELPEAMSPSSLHKAATFKPNLAYNDSHRMFFGKNSKTCDFMKRKSKMLSGGSCYYRHILGSVCVIK